MTCSVVVVLQVSRSGHACGSYAAVTCIIHLTWPFAMDNLLPARRLANFAASTAVVIDNAGRLYPKHGFAELLTDIMFRKCCDKRSASSLVRKAMSNDACLQLLALVIVI